MQRRPLQCIKAVKAVSIQIHVLYTHAPITNTFTGCTFDPLSDRPDPFSLGVERGVETGVDTTTIEFDSATLSKWYREILRKSFTESRLTV